MRWSRLSMSVLPRLLVVLHDLAMVVVAWQGLIYLRYLQRPEGRPPEAFVLETLMVVALQLVVFWRVGLYRGLWRFASLPDILNIVVSASLGAAAAAVVLWLHDRAEGVPRSVLMLYPLALTALLGAPRLLYRAWKDAQGTLRDRSPRVRLLILGAGASGESLARDLRRGDRYQPIGFLDDDRSIHGGKVYGLPVLGGMDDLPRIAEETAAQQAAIALPNASPELLARVIRLCEVARLPVRRIPTHEEALESELAGGLKEIAIEDLLGRDPVVPDWPAIQAGLVGRSVLITGAGGSIGSELSRQCAAVGVGQLVLVEQSEHALHTLKIEMRRRFPALAMRFVLGDCADEVLMRKVLAEAQPEDVFHAAAYKHVPLLEGQPREAIRNNALATDTLARLCAEAGVAGFVLISTDKAVNPVNMLGASKRLAEMCAHLRCAAGGTRFVTVRFGNVLDSAGSVVPLFREQIARGGPITVTHPEVTRYFMTIPEACQLILQTAAQRDVAGVFTLDMGKPVLIQALAEQMIRLAGLRPYDDITIVHTGLRPGEKLHEELFRDDEVYAQTLHPKIFQTEPRSAVAPPALESALRALRQAVAQHDEDEIRRLLGELMPEFIPQPGRTTGAFRPQLIQGGRNA
jgi:FlaA1/EpsC-like NDP-sugar epimerase